MNPRHQVGQVDYNPETALRIELLERQIEALRSVISEMNEGERLDCYLQWQHAEAIAQLLNYVKRTT